MNFVPSRKFTLQPGQNITYLTHVFKCQSGLQQFVSSLRVITFDVNESFFEDHKNGVVAGNVGIRDGRFV